MSGAVGLLRERVSIQAHLAHYEFRLRLATRPDQSARLALLDHLHEYWQAGEFPRNCATRGRRPVFIDDSGVHCAVGHLMSRTGAGHLASEFDRHDRFARIEELPSPMDPQFRRWLDKHELSREEAALIQPGYGPCGMSGWGCEGYVHTGMTTGGTLIASASLVVSLGLFVPMVLLAWMARRHCVVKMRRLSQHLGALLLAGAAAFPLAAGALLAESKAMFFLWEAVMWAMSALVAVLVVLRLWRLRRQRPMIGFDETAVFRDLPKEDADEPKRSATRFLEVVGEYQRPARITFMVIFALLFWDLALSHGITQPYIAAPSGSTAVPTVRRWHVNIMVLSALPILWAHESLQRCTRRVVRTAAGIFAASIAALTLVLPSPAHAAYTLVPIDSLVVCWNTTGPVCVENGDAGSPPRLLKFSAWVPFEEIETSDRNGAP
ncbi:hypothetical protein [Candidatus Poriferisodalis sp.]|uniref:hypothetical protein n=1 Tax=Candidatus Poriferisodalis sp. TaxID=3101277 RepID=UPI003B01D081